MVIIASFVIHHIAGVKLLDKLKNQYNIDITKKEENQFLLGNLIVDSVKTKLSISDSLSEDEIKRICTEYKFLVQKEKESTHFRDEKDLELNIQSPNLDRFINKYYDLLINNFSVLGYFFHLYTDKMFFVNLFNDTFECLDANKNLTIYLNETKIVRVKKNNKFYDISDFFNIKHSFSLYNDYTTINKILLDYYKINFNKDELLNFVPSFINPGIEEVDYSNITSIINKTDTFINESYELDNIKLNVFDEVLIEKFIEEVTNNFFNEYGKLINSYAKKLQRKK